MEVQDFLPKYPDIDQSQYEVLNPYKEDFYQAIFRKKEFYENRLEKAEVFPHERGMLTKYQKTVARFMSAHTPYNFLLLIHSMGTGKTCSAIGAVEQIRQDSNVYKGALVLAKGDAILENFLKELVERCTAGQYIPEGYSKMSLNEKMRYAKKKTRFYQRATFAKFAKKIRDMSDEDITGEYSDRIIIIDEVHNLRIRDKRDEEGVETYYQFHRFLHLVNNCKVLFLSGTPMKDSPEEIASVANLMLPLDQQFPTGEEFLEEYMDQVGESYVMKAEKIPEFKAKMKGKISFLKESSSSIPREYIGVERYGRLQHFVVDPGIMSPFQTQAYLEAWQKDTTGDRGVYHNSREASLFVYPDGSYGSAGFKKYIVETKNAGIAKGAETSSYQMSKELEKALVGKDPSDTLQNIAKYSITYAKVIEQIFNTEGNCFVYSSIVQGSGAILFSLLLKLFGFKKASGQESTPQLRYAILSNLTADTPDIRKIVERFNRKDNIRGDYIKVIIGSKAVSEGFSFKNVVFEAINTPHWNYSETAQALARGIRLGSHNDLYKLGEKPIVRIMQPVSIPDAEESISIDQYMYEMSEDKDISIRAMLRLLMEVAFDCGLNYMRNYVEGEKGSRECDYTVCEYECDGLDMDQVLKGIPEEELDFSTYQLYYANPRIPAIRRRIEQLFRKNYRLDLSAIIRNLKDEFTEDEIRNALVLIQDETEKEEFDYSTFLEYYSRSSVKKIMNIIERLFRENFRLDLGEIIENVTQEMQVTEFEVLTALRELINNSSVLTNKYGLPSYLREERDKYFLVPSLSIKSDFYTEYYVQYPSIQAGEPFEKIMGKLYQDNLPIAVQNICMLSENIELFEKGIKNLPIKIQEMFVEAAVTATIRGIISDVSQLILELYKGYIQKAENIWSSSLLSQKDEGSLRCVSEEAPDDWADCDSTFAEKLQEAEQQRLQEIKESNPYGIMGLYNPETDSFCILDFEKEKQSREKVSQKRAKGTVDKRLTYSGKVCGAGGWKLVDLLRIAIIRLEMDPPLEYELPGDEYSVKEFIKNPPDGKPLELTELFAPEDIDMASEEQLRRMAYWGLPKKNGGVKGIKPICESIKAWLEERGLLQVDNKCGVQGKKKAIGSEKKEANYRVEVMVPMNEEAKFRAYVKDMAKLMSACLNIPKYKPAPDYRKWFLAFLGNKLVGVVILSEGDARIDTICVQQDYRKRFIGADIMSAVADMVKDYVSSISVQIDNKDRNADYWIQLYEKLGFTVLNATDKYTEMLYQQ